MSIEDLAGAASYPVLVRRHNSEFRLQIKELALVVRGPNLERAYEELKRRHLDLLIWAKAADAIDEMPEPRRILMGRRSYRRLNDREQNAVPGSR